jgi:hypothetical protein
MRVHCGNETCDVATERCSGRAPDQGQVEPFACEPRGQVICSGGCLVIECGGPEDCPTGEVCHFYIGENYYFRCDGRPDRPWASCTTDADCSGAYPFCTNLQDTTYGASLGDLSPIMGFEPRVCDQARDGG